MTRRHLLSRTLPGWAVITRGQFVELFLEVSPGVYELRGMPATLVLGTQFMGETGVYVIEGQGAAFKRSLLLPAGAGQYILAGQSATLEPGFTMVAGGGAYTVEGQQAAFLRDLRLLAAAGEYTVSGQPAALKRAGISPASAGSYVLAGQAATFSEVSSAASIVFTDSDSSTTNGASYSFASQAIGDAAADRVVLVAVNGFRAAIADPTSVTVGGISAAKLVASIGTGNDSYVGIYAAEVPTGTTATVEVNWAANSTHCGIAVAAAYGVASITPVDTAADNSTNPHDVSLDAAMGSVAFAAAAVRANATWAWTGLTEGSDEYIESNVAFSAATGDIAAAGTATISAESSATSASARSACSVCLE